MQGTALRAEIAKQYIEMEDFEAAKARKWGAGRIARGLPVDGPFSPDDEPLSELYDEMLDSHTYSEVAEARYGIAYTLFRWHIRIFAGKVRADYLRLVAEGKIKPKPR